MIQNHDRSGWFGASDTSYIVGNWKTKSFARWWLVKLGATSNNYTTNAMRVGTYYEHSILEAIGINKCDRQIRMRRLRLRVNLDGESDSMLYEVKTSIHAAKVTAAYWRQAQVEMFAAQKPLTMVFYKLTEKEYDNFFLPIDLGRIVQIPVEPNSEWIFSEYLPRLKYLEHCLKKKKTPSEDHFHEMQNKGFRIFFGRKTANYH